MSQDHNVPAIPPLSGDHWDVAAKPSHFTVSPSIWDHIQPPLHPVSRKYQFCCAMDGKTNPQQCGSSLQGFCLSGFAQDSRMDLWQVLHPLWFPMRWEKLWRYGFKSYLCHWLLRDLRHFAQLL
jgi:hypothetical protein